jgi:hypothetical protein
MLIFEELVAILFVEIGHELILVLLFAIFLNKRHKLSRFLLQIHIGLKLSLRKFGVVLLHIG